MKIANPFTAYTPIERTIVLDEYYLSDSDPEAPTIQRTEQDSPEKDIEQQPAENHYYVMSEEIGVIDAWYRQNMVLINMAQWFIIGLLIMEIYKLKK